MKNHSGILVTLALCGLLSGCGLFGWGKKPDMLAEARRLAGMGEYAAATGVVADIVRSGAPADVLQDAAGWALLAERFDLAVDWSNLLLAQRAQSIEGRRVRGLALLALDRPAEAVGDLEFVVARTPPDRELQRGLGLALFRSGGDRARASNLLELSGAQDEAVRKALADLRGENLVTAPAAHVPVDTAGVARAIARTFTAYGPDESSAVQAARHEAAVILLQESLAEAGLTAAEARQVERTLAEMERAGGAPALAVDSQGYDPSTGLATLVVRLQGDKGAFARAARPELRVRVEAEGPLLAHDLLATFRDRLALAGLRVVEAGPVDALVTLRGEGREEPGGAGGFKAWRFTLHAQARDVDPLDGSMLLLADSTLGPDKAVYGSDEAVKAREALLPLAAQSADTLARRIQRAAAADVVKTLTVSPVADRATLDALLDGLQAAGEPAGFLGVGELRQSGSFATVRLLLDRRGADSLGSVLESLRLPGGRRVKLVGETATTAGVVILPGS